MGINTLYFYKINKNGKQVINNNTHTGWQFIDDTAIMTIQQKCFHTALSVFNLAKKELR